MTDTPAKDLAQQLSDLELEVANQKTQVIRLVGCAVDIWATLKMMYVNLPESEQKEIKAMLDTLEERLEEAFADWKKEGLLD